jgi:energy-coupling factor transporter ATP-binding protein EcfA2
MLPFIVGAGVISLGVGIYKWLSEDDAVKPYPWFSEKTIIIGPTESGKSKLAEILANIDSRRDIPNQVGKEKLNPCQGQEEYVNTEWQEAIKGAQNCIYVFNLKYYADNIAYEGYDYQQIILLHLDLIHDWICNSNSYYPKFIALGTYGNELETDIKIDSIVNEIKLKLKTRGKETILLESLNLNATGTIKENLQNFIDKAPYAK